MSYKPKKTRKGKVGEQNKDKRDFLERQRDKYQDIKKNLYNYNIRKSFEIINDKMKKFNPKEYVADKYRKFSENVKDPENKKLLKLIPAVLLAITVLALKNKKLIKPFIQAFYSNKTDIKPGMSMTDKFLFILNEYGNLLYKNANIFTTLEISMTILTLFLEDIPSLFVKLDSYTGISQFDIQKKLIQNAVELKVELIDKPAQERKREEQLEKEIKENKELRDAIKELKTKLGMKDKSNPQNSTISERLLLIKSIEKLEKASSSKDNKKQDNKSSKGNYLTKKKHNRYTSY